MSLVPTEIFFMGLLLIRPEGHPGSSFLQLQGIHWHNQHQPEWFNL